MEKEFSTSYLNDYIEPVLIKTEIPWIDKDFLNSWISILGIWDINSQIADLYAITDDLQEQINDLTP